MKKFSVRYGAGPLYRQVKDLVVERIVEGVWAPGERLPSETALAAELGIAPGTVRTAFGELARENIVVRHQGRGTFVSAHSPQRELFHFFHMVGAAGEKSLPMTIGPVACERRRAGREECERLDLAAGVRVIVIERIRQLSGHPVILERLVLPAARFPGLGQEGEIPNELYQLYEEDYGVTIFKAVERISAVAAGRGEAKALRLPVGAPLLEIDRVAETLEGTPVEWRTSRCDTRAHVYLSEIV